MKVFVGGIATETNTFATAPTGAAGFVVSRPGDVDYPPLAILQRLAKEGGDTIAPGLFADAQPLGPTVREVYEGLRDELLGDLKRALPVDAVVLPLHGAMVADGYPDCEGDLIKRARTLVGPNVPIGVELDLHCHVTKRMLGAADIIIAYKEYPHTDVEARLEEVWRLTLATARGKIRPMTAAVDCRMVGFWHTTREPGAGIVRKMTAFEASPGVLSVSFGHGFPWGDVPESGAKVWVITDGDEALASRVAETLRTDIWNSRESTRGYEIDLATAIRTLIEAPAGRPIVIADIADNAGGGASSDSTFVLRALIDAQIGDVALGAFWDLGAIQTCREAGEGARLNLRIGGKCGPLSGDPVDLAVTVRRVKEAHEQSQLGLSPTPCGPSVWVSTETGIDLVLISTRQQVYGTNMFTGLGIDLARKRAIVVKSSQHFHQEFAPLASRVLYVDTPGLLRSDFANIPYTARPLNFWPRVADPWV